MKKFTTILLMLGVLAGTLVAANLVEAGRGGGGGGGGRSVGRSAPGRYTPQYTPPYQTHMAPPPGQTPPATGGDKTGPKSNDMPGSSKDKDSKKSKKDKQKNKNQSGGGGGGDGGGDDGGDDGSAGGDAGGDPGVAEGPAEEGAPPVPVTATAAPVTEVSPAAKETDLELIEVRCVDAGAPAKNQGPCFRVCFRNNSPTVIGTSFRVGVLASLSRNFDQRSPRAVIEVKGMKPGEVLAVDLRLPVQVNALGRNLEGRSLPFAFLAAVVDCEQALNDANRDNNVAVLGRLEIPMVEE